MCRASRPAAQQDGVAGLHRRRDAVSAGVGDDEIRRRCAIGSWRRVRRGAYAEASLLAELDDVARHRLAVAALLPEMAADAVVSHQSAAVMLGAPMSPALLDRVHVTRNRRHGGRIKPNLKVHCAPVTVVAERQGLLVTSPARTVIDLARTLPFESAVVVGDALAREFGVTAPALARELACARGRRGVDGARHVIGFLDPRSGGVEHSRIRVLLRLLGFPPAAAGGVIHADDGRVLGTADLYLGRTGVVLEVDGHRPIRARAHGGPSRRTPDAVLRRYGFQLVRTTWRGLSAGGTAERVHAALSRAREQRPRGYIRPAPLEAPTPLRLRAL
ncbi:hypothetical protein C5E45_12445 [Nocardia nova]|uniref:AbiEi antitoxin C-terminal domain-containing protein n=1 Tax=Nocardia nova TaxID=37330 RepID=A0A2S6ASA2_9NOCA|nr:hypothetical protein C5E41_11440 [Nocardia nova]PPJ38125.1 hypothetical protein C5E45_12445 [Nocardia nova]